MQRLAKPAWLVLIAAAALSACGGEGLRAGGQYSGVPDTTFGDPRMPLGTIDTDGTVRMFREEGWR